jgi:hypothetical protein
MNLPLEDYISRKHPASGINIFNRCNPFPIAWLNKMRLPRHISLCNYLSSCNQAHSEASFIKIIDIFIGDAILHLDPL